MKRLVYCLLIMTMMSAMVSCGSTASGKIDIQTTTAGLTAPPKYPTTTEQAPVVINADSYLGSWSGGKCIITVSRNDEGYIADIDWREGGGAFMKDCKLSYKCVYNESDSTMICSDGVLYETEYSDDGAGPENKVYDDGTAVLKINVETREWQNKELHEYTLSWLDDKDDSFSDWVFCQ